MEKTYCKKEDWKRLELLVGSYRDLWKSSLVSIIRKLEIEKSLRVLDLGSGTSFISGPMLQEIACHQYIGIDLDGGAFELAHNNLPSAIERDFIVDSAISEKSLTAATHVDLIICLSNTFLCFGSKEQLSEYLVNLEKYSKANFLLISVVPWGEFQKQYISQFKSWFSLLNAASECWVKMEASEELHQVKQKIWVKDGLSEVSTIEHNFCRLSAPEIESLFSVNGWRVDGWYSPIDAKEISNPAVAELPEFFIVCSKIEKREVLTNCKGD